MDGELEGVAGRSYAAHAAVLVILTSSCAFILQPIERSAMMAVYLASTQLVWAIVANSFGRAGLLTFLVVPLAILLAQIEKGRRWLGFAQNRQREFLSKVPLSPSVAKVACEKRTRPA